MAQQAAARPERSGSPDPSPVDGRLRFAAIVFAGGLALHTADHLRRGVGVLTPEVLWGGTVLTVAGVITIAAVLARHRLAAKVAVVVGFYSAVSVAASHLLPRCGVGGNLILVAGISRASHPAPVDVPAATKA